MNVPLEFNTAGEELTALAVILGLVLVDLGRLAVAIWRAKPW